MGDNLVCAHNMLYGKRLCKAAKSTQFLGFALGYILSRALGHVEVLHETCFK